MTALLLVTSLLVLSQIEGGNLSLDPELVDRFYHTDQSSEAFLDVETYLEQVYSNNEEFIATEEMRQNYLVRTKEGSLLFAPRLISTVMRSHKENPQFIPYFPIFLIGSDLFGREYTVGVEQETQLGLQWRAESSTVESKVVATLPNFGLSSTNINWSVTQSLSFKQPLWKNAFGKRTRAKARLAEYAALSHANAEAFKLKNAQSKAESIYWRLVLARALTQVRCESLQQAEKLLAFVENKRSESLVMESDVLQARSVLNINRIDYQKARESETAIALQFNGLRGVASSEVCENLVTLSGDLIDLMTPKEKGTRADLKSNEAAFKGQEAENLISQQDLSPDFDFIAQVGYTGNSNKFGTSFEQSFQHPAKSTLIMFRLTFPLSFKAGSVKRAYRRSTNSARMNLERMKFEHDQQWAEFNARLNENKKLLQLLFESAELQREKFENTKSDYELGLSTFFAVTSAESDYQGAKIAILQTFQVMLDLLLNLGLYKE